MTATIARPRQPHSDWLARLRTITTTALPAIKPPYSARERWQAAYSLWRRGRWTLEAGQSPADMALDTLRMAFAPPFQRPFSSTFDRRAAAAPAWWVVAGKTCVAAYQPIKAGSQALSYVNLANPGTYDAAPGVAPTWASATGWTFNGSSQYLTTGVAPAQDQSWSILCRVDSITTAEGAWVLGSGLGGGRYFGLMSFSGGASAFLYGGFTQSGDTTPTGVFGLAGNTGYRNGAPVAGSISAPTDTLGAIFIGATNWFSSALGYAAGNVLAVVIYSDTLSAGEVAAKSAAMAAL